MDENSYQINHTDLSNSKVVSHLIYRGTWVTSVDELFELINNYLLTNKFKMGSLSITTWSSQLFIVLDGIYLLGQIQALQGNDLETLVNVWGYPTEYENKTEELYEETVHLLTAMCRQFESNWEEIINLIKIGNEQYHPRNLGLPFKSSGRPTNPGYDAAFILVKHGKSYQDAYDFWVKKYRKNVSYHENTTGINQFSDPFDCFRSAMNYRKRKLKKREENTF